MISMKIVGNETRNKLTLSIPVIFMTQFDT